MTSLLPTTPPRKDLGYFFAFPEGLLLRFPRGATSSLSQRGYFFAFPEGPGPGMSRQKRMMQL
ncbi:unannotated protein [freshwater metagenome]|uniref:Unannotated protein n=1 Tax=freshwater metagenome TaxID=449393 RepID=A0A6J6YPA2_9ZZZZ